MKYKRYIESMLTMCLLTLRNLLHVGLRIRLEPQIACFMRKFVFIIPLLPKAYHNAPRAGLVPVRQGRRSFDMLSDLLCNILEYSLGHVHSYRS